MHRALALLLFGVCGVLVQAHPARAHASLLETSPANGAIVAHSPDVVTLRFNEPVVPVAFRMINPDGKAASLTSFSATNETISIKLAAPLGRGTHLLSWRVISADSHPVGGSLTFAVGRPSDTPASSAAGVSVSTPIPLAAAIWLARIALYLGLFGGIGGVFFVSWIAALEGRTTIRGGLYVMLVAGVAGALLGLGLQGLDTLGLNLTDFFSPAAWSAALATTYAATMAAALGGLLAAGLALILRAHPVAKVLTPIGVLCTALALGSSGHSATTARWISQPAIFIHAIGITYWAGAAWPLLVLCRRPDATLAGVLRRFSWLAVPLVALVLTAGMAMATIEIPTPSALWSTSYGRVLAAKLVVVACLLALAAFNLFRAMPALEARTGSASMRLARSMALECLGFLAVFGLVALWRFTPPPRAIALADTLPAHLHIHTPQAMVDLSLTPGRAGPVTASLFFETGDFEALVPKEVTLELSQPSAGIEPLESKAHLDDDGSWKASGIIIPRAGLWYVSVKALITDFQEVTLADDIEIR